MSDPIFQPMAKSGKSLRVTRKKKFVRHVRFEKEDICPVVEFAFGMTFGGEGAHRAHRSGGSIVRNNPQIYADAFQGKLSEFAFYNMFRQFEGVNSPDLSKHRLGIWEDVDFSFGDCRIAIKSAKYFSNLLLLECKDWDLEGVYLPNHNDATPLTHLVLVRIEPDVRSIVSELKTSSNGSLYEQILAATLKHKWYADFAGFITHQDLIGIISSDLVISKGDYLNGSMPMDADNYYVQAGDLRPIQELVTIIAKNDS